MVTASIVPCAEWAVEQPSRRAHHTVTVNIPRCGAVKEIPLDSFVELAVKNLFKEAYHSNVDVVNMVPKCFPWQQMMVSMHYKCDINQEFPVLAA